MCRSPNITTDFMTHVKNLDVPAPIVKRFARVRIFIRIRYLNVRYNQYKEEKKKETIFEKSIKSFEREQRFLLKEAKLIEKSEKLFLKEQKIMTKNTNTTNKINRKRKAEHLKDCTPVQRKIIKKTKKYLH